MLLERGHKMNNVIITLRNNEEIKKELDRLALEDNRSLNNYIVNVLIKHIDEEKRKKINKKLSGFESFSFYLNSIKIKNTI